MAFDRDFQSRDSRAGSSAESDVAPGRLPYASRGEMSSIDYSGPSVFGGMMDGGMMDGGMPDLSGIDLDSFGGNAVEPAEGAESPTDLAEQGAAGGARPLPYKDELERSFGVSLDGIEAYTDENAEHANSRLRSSAYAAGNRVVFGNPDPDKSLVAHEVMHVLQQNGGDGGNGVDRSGEGEAEAVEAAVAGGGPAKSALNTDPRKLAVKRGGAGQRPALSSPFTSGMSFSPSALEQTGTWNFWRPAGIRAPTGVPLLFLTAAPSGSLTVGGGVNWRNRSVTARVTADGSVALGLSYGVPSLAELYLNAEAGLSGGFTYERSRAVAPTTGNQRPATRPTDTWTLQGGVVLQTAFNVGVRMGGGIIDKRFQFGQCEIGRVTGLYWRDGVFQRNRTGWQWGPTPLRFYAEMQRLLRRAREIANMPREAAQSAWRGLANAHGWAWRGAGNIIAALNPWG